MQITSAAPTTSSQLPSTSKSKVVPPGLANRGLDLPPGIAKKLEAGGTAPAGITKRFPAVAVQGGAPASETNETDVDGVASPPDGSPQDTDPSVDLLV
jgi:hypothetical protein